MQETVKDLKQTRYVLKLWGEYMRLPAASDTRLSHPKIACHLSEGGGRQKRAPRVPVPSPVVQKVIHAMESLGKFDGSAYMALRHKYEFESTNEDAASDLNTALTTYKDWLVRGEYWVAGRIS